MASTLDKGFCCPQTQSVPRTGQVAGSLSYGLRLVTSGPKLAGSAMTRSMNSSASPRDVGSLAGSASMSPVSSMPEVVSGAGSEVAPPVARVLLPSPPGLPPLEHATSTSGASTRLPYLRIGPPYATIRHPVPEDHPDPMIAGPCGAAVRETVAPSRRVRCKPLTVSHGALMTGNPHAPPIG